MKNNEFNKYLNKLKLKGKYSSRLDESTLVNEGILGDLWKKHKERQAIKNDPNMEIFRVTGDFSSKGFRDCVINIYKSEKSENNDSTKRKETLIETIKNFIEKIDKLARDGKSDKNGYLYSWIQEDKMYFYFDTAEHAKTFFNNNVLENNIGLNLKEEDLKKMFSIERCVRDKKIIKKKIETCGNLYKFGDSDIKLDNSNVGALSDQKTAQEEINAAKKLNTTDTGNIKDFAEKCADLIFNQIDKAVFNSAKGDTITCGQLIWKWSDEDIKQFVKNSPSLKSGEELKTEVKKKLDELLFVDNKLIYNMYYAAGTNKGNIILKFETLTDAEEFKEHAEGNDDFVGEFSEAKEELLNTKYLKSKQGQIHANMLLNRIAEMYIQKQAKTPAVLTVKIELKNNVNIGKDTDPYSLINENTFKVFNKIFNKIVLNETSDKHVKKPKNTNNNEQNYEINPGAEAIWYVFGKVDEMIQTYERKGFTLERVAKWLIPNNEDESIENLSKLLDNKKPVYIRYEVNTVIIENIKKYYNKLNAVYFEITYNNKNQ